MEQRRLGMSNRENMTVRNDKKDCNLKVLSEQQTKAVSGGAHTSSWQNGYEIGYVIGEVANIVYQVAESM